MSYVNACIIAFAMYSKIPMPKAAWSKENMQYAMCFFPWVGAVIGACIFLWAQLARTIPMGSILFAAVFSVLPVLITGGIHLDGLLDTADALSSYQPTERRLEILKDPHAGAFAVICGCTYFLCYFGFASELSAQGLPVIAVSFFFSRCLSGYAVTAFSCAKHSGLAAAFAEGAHRKRAGIALLVQAALSGVLMVGLQPVLGVAAIVAALLTFWWYHGMSMKKFGGITGDLAGCFLQVCELMMLIAVVFTAKI